MLGIFGHGNVAGIGQALDEYQAELPFVQGRNEQSLVHIASGYAKANRRTAALAVTASIGPGAANMVTGAALATVNRLPVLLFPGDTYATRRQGPVLQQLEHATEGDVSRQRLLPAGGALLRSHHAPGAAADRAARGDARAHQPGRGRRGGDRAAAGHPDRGVRLPGRVLRSRATGRSTARRRIRTRSRRSPS